jgi:hypothetical protein
MISVGISHVPNPKQRKKKPPFLAPNADKSESNYRMFFGENTCLRRERREWEIKAKGMKSLVHRIS